MSLIQEIDRTNTSKEKTKTVAVKIDNKLVELGGEQAINLADVPEKMQKMVDNYIKYAYIADLPSSTKSFSFDTGELPEYKYIGGVIINRRLSFESLMEYAEIDVNIKINENPWGVSYIPEEYNKSFKLSSVKENKNQIITKLHNSSDCIRYYKFGVRPIDRDKAEIQIFHKIEKKTHSWDAKSDIRITVKYLESFSKVINKSV